MKSGEPSARKGSKITCTSRWVVCWFVSVLRPSLDSSASHVKNIAFLYGDIVYISSSLSPLSFCLTLPTRIYTLILIILRTPYGSSRLNPDFYSQRSVGDLSELLALRPCPPNQLHTITSSSRASHAKPAVKKSTCMRRNGSCHTPSTIPIWLLMESRWTCCMRRTSGGPSSWWNHMSRTLRIT